MSNLALFGRPYVVFDPTNKNHRRWFADFIKNRSWGKCPVRFVIENDYGDLVSMIQRKLIEYYVDKEFNKTLGENAAINAAKRVKFTI